MDAYDVGLGVSPGGAVGFAVSPDAVVGFKVSPGVAAGLSSLPHCQQNTAPRAWRAPQEGQLPAAPASPSFIRRSTLRGRKRRCAP